MPPAKLKYRGHEAIRAFSLVEVMLALGIFTFAIMAVFGLLSVSVTSDKSAASDTAIAQMSATALSLIRAQSFYQIKTNTLFSGTAPAFYFDLNGQIGLNSSGPPDTTTHTNSYYSCTIQRTVSPSSTNLLYLQYTFRWPIFAPATNQQSRVLNTTIGNYD